MAGVVPPVPIPIAAIPVGNSQTQRQQRPRDHVRTETAQALDAPEEGRATWTNASRQRGKNERGSNLDIYV